VLTILQGRSRFSLMVLVTSVPEMVGGVDSSASFPFSPFRGCFRDIFLSPFHPSDRIRSIPPHLLSSENESCRLRTTVPRGFDVFSPPAPEHPTILSPFPGINFPTPLRIVFTPLFLQLVDFPLHFHAFSFFPPRTDWPLSLSPHSGSRHRSFF